MTIALCMDAAELDAELDRLTDDIRPQARAEAWKAFQRAPHALELDELHSIALTGLAQARARWRTYCAKNEFSPEATQFYAAYCLRRIRGAILDAMRANDWVTRSARTRAKKMRDAGADRGLTEAQVSAATGLTAREIRETAAAVAARPVSFDAEPHDVADCAEDVEGAAVVSGILGCVTEVIVAMPELQRSMLVLRYYEGLTVAAAAEAAGVSPDEGREAFEAAVCRVHDEMLKAVA